MLTKRIYVHVVGRVQEVGYRRWATMLAQNLDLVGWVRNRDDDGSVEMEAQGPEAALDKLVAACKEGPPASKVSAVHVEARNNRDGERSFVIRR